MYVETSTHTFNGANKTTCQYTYMYITYSLNILLTYLVMNVYTASGAMMNRTTIYNRIGIILNLNSSYSVTVNVIILQKSLKQNDYMK